MDTGTQLAVAAIISSFVSFLKGSKWFPWLTAETAKLNRVVVVILSGFGAIGIHVTFHGGTLIATGLTLTTIGLGLWHWLVQALYTHGWFKATSASNEILVLLKAWVATQSAPPTMFGGGSLSTATAWSPSAQQQTSLPTATGARLLYPDKVPYGGDPLPSPTSPQKGLSMKLQPALLALCAFCLLRAPLSAAQAVPAPAPPQPTAFPSTTVNFNLTPVTVPGSKQSLAGAETDAILKLSTNLSAGSTMLIGSGYSFIGGRGQYVIPQFSKWLNNTSSTLNGYQFQLYATASLGVVRSPDSFVAGQTDSHWGQRAGMGLNYSVNGSTGLGIEAQWVNFPGYAHSTYSLAFGPNFHF